MDKRRMVLILLVVVGVPLFIWIQFFEMPSKVKIGEEKLQQDPLTHDFEKVLPYENAYMGDASNINELFGALPLNASKGTIELDPEMYAIIVNYDSLVDEVEEQTKQAVIYNSTAAFTLIENLEEVTFRFKDQSYVVTRDFVEKWFGMTLIDFKDPDVFKEKVQNKLGEDVDLWLQAYTEGE